ncbi:MAG: hypothetical protein A2860_04225 [Candidatus Levybacteria bacterium RIFCSPHIGHO2_01_FULL_37_33]|uniref:S-adenosyl-L-homocysteine hydrolase NAD binding domain-containing protein n=1 Tax=Candidatus Blackburnbacteria bacterium RIFCSPLOWO2_01_FULL_41_27 TaxID=1797520 RepID=A0A1G1VCK9_9BACT|nr:MAG: hypothetical protein A2860_04225 [Candidatus Levybacteria bacterium RIFCSPHIGHO2_01_FULL_37_33]OGH15848.1 MAG: hypothetical protein A3C97_00620 [Candidatus Levybacteria bacterium RIFCSPHIGHO2_02_FULL_37_11]OGH30150.1 MAG: hypothetical protein A3F30_00650 [Candidatus Levybacteria bacterium RIFCSPHIGHO2_12_FULL_37_12]OGY13178.1 MAG: hypothetical protein A3A58_02000 [Candidatus Blackburnbacteria bacterium RIFCSPLOWO2_01_FULL_41_27]
MSLSSNINIFKSIVRNIDTSGYSFVFIFHLSENNHPYLKYWLQHVDNLGVVSIPYSELPNVRFSIEKTTKVYTPALNEIPNCIFQICQDNSDKKIVLVEIGGYSAQVAHLLDNVVLAVEDTNQGHWNFENNTDKLTFPVVSMAQAHLKKLEDHLIGDSIVYSTQMLLRKYFKQDYVLGKRVLVLSYGGIGSSVCKSLKALKADVSVYDIDPLKQAQAYFEGFRIVKKIDALSTANIIIGCSGKQSIKFNELRFINNGALLVSGSSKQVEFPYDKIKEHIVRNQGVELDEVKVAGKNFFIAYKGQPINFLHDSALGDIFEIQMSLLCSCIEYGLKSKLKPGIYNIPIEYQRAIAKQYVERKISRI